MTLGDQIKLDISIIPQLGGSPWYGFAIRAHAALIEEGLSPAREQVVGWDCAAVTATVHTEEVGIITFSEIKHLNRIDIGVGFVLPDFRRRGIYRFMWEALVEESRKRGVAQVWGFSSPNNLTFPRVAIALGRYLALQGFCFDIPLK